MPVALLSLLDPNFLPWQIKRFKPLNPSVKVEGLMLDERAYETRLVLPRGERCDIHEEVVSSALRDGDIVLRRGVKQGYSLHYADFRVIGKTHLLCGMSDARFRLKDGVHAPTVFCRLLKLDISALGLVGVARFCETAMIDPEPDEAQSHAAIGHLLMARIERDEAEVRAAQFEAEADKVFAKF